VEAIPKDAGTARKTRGALEWTGTDLGAGDRRFSLEWLETDGLGGFACGTAEGMSVRRYHGWYAPAARHVNGRSPLVAGCEELVWCDGVTTKISRGEREPGPDQPGGSCLARFALEPFPTWRYETEKFSIERSLCLVRGRSIAIARYANRGRRTFGLRTRPLLRAAGPAGERRGDPAVEVRGEAVCIASLPNLPRLYAWGTGGLVVEESGPFDAGPARAEDNGDRDRMWSPVAWDWILAPGQQRYLVFSREEVSTDPAQLFEAERARRESFASTNDPVFDELARRAEIFLVDGDAGDGSIVGGYPEAVAWSRDSMISVPGLTLATGRHAGASRVVSVAAARLRAGSPAENAGFAAGDAALWFVLAVEWFTRFRRSPSRPTPLLAAVRNVLSACREDRGSGIAVEPDGLMSGFFPGRPLTWMDAVVDGQLVTPRYGRAVEVNALWHAALKAAARLERLAEEGGRARELEGEAWHVARRFNEVFWCAQKEYLYDVVGPDDPDSSLRPNQIFAVSLSEDLLPPHRARAVYRAVRNHLLTPLGLRTLDPRDPRYRGRCAGSPRDCSLALHQGAAWPWLLGAFNDAHFRVLGRTPEARRSMRVWLDGVRTHIREAGVGSISEVFDGDDPQVPRGCFAQAGSVAEIARIFYTYLNSKP
jgi:glycogen debranching enzyme